VCSESATFRRKNNGYAPVDGLRFKPDGGIVLSAVVSSGVLLIRSAPSVRVKRLVLNPLLDSFA
jgi:hypothetical protein